MHQGELAQACISHSPSAWDLRSLGWSRVSPELESMEHSPAPSLREDPAGVTGLGLALPWWWEERGGPRLMLSANR